MSNERILIVDDEVELAEIMRDFLLAEGYMVTLSFDGKDAVRCFKEYSPQLVILDIMLPFQDGMEVLKTIRSVSNVPVLILSAKKSDLDKILGLGFGADDYITKPVSSGELIARVKAQLRRYMQFSIPSSNNEIIEFGKIKINSRSYSVIIEDTEIDLSAKEFELLYYLAKNPNQVFTREQLFNQVWGFDEFGDINTVAVHIRKIREKIESDPSNPRFIKTVWGIGYKFDGGKS